MRQHESCVCKHVTAFTMRSLHASDKSASINNTASRNNGSEKLQNSFIVHNTLYAVTTAADIQHNIYILHQQQPQATDLAYANCRSYLLCGKVSVSRIKPHWTVKKYFFHDMVHCMLLQRVSISILQQEQTQATDLVLAYADHISLW